MLKYPIFACPEYYKRINKEALSPINRNKRIIEALKLTQRPVKRAKNIHQGMAEEYFWKYLVPWFRGNVHRNCAVKEYKDSGTFIPDFFYQDPESNLHIDIEIDEPYDFKSKTPTHYLIGPKMHLDDSRNNYFNNLGWFVVRFTELQIIRFPNQCCFVISKLINEIIGKRYHKQNINISLETVDCWTQEEAIKMVDDGKRDFFQEFLKMKKFIESYLIIIEFLNIKITFKNSVNEIMKDQNSDKLILNFKGWEDFKRWENEQYLIPPILEHQ